MTTTDQPKAPERRIWHLFGEPAALTRQQFMSLWSGCVVAAVSEWDKAPLAPEPAPPPVDLERMREHVAESLEKAHHDLSISESELLQAALDGCDQESMRRSREQVLMDRTTVCVVETWLKNLNGQITFRRVDP